MNILIHIIILEYADICGTFTAYNLRLNFQPQEKYEINTSLRFGMNARHTDRHIRSRVMTCEFQPPPPLRPRPLISKLCNPRQAVEPY